MTGKFELVVTNRGAFGFRLLSSTGEVLAVSETYSDKDTAVAAIRDARESAAMALINDCTLPPRPSTPSPAAPRFNAQGPSRWFG
ncbi:DUF1508 domain-containing protein [Arthrobacter sp. D1-29]